MMENNVELDGYVKDVNDYKYEERQLDFVVIYSKHDEDRAKELVDLLRGIEVDGKKLDGFLINEEQPFKWMMQGTFDSCNYLYTRSTFHFFVVTDNLWKDAEFVLQKNEAIMKDLRKQDQTLIPVWYTKKFDLSDQAFEALYGLTSVNGIDPESKRFETTIQKMTSMQMFKDLKKAREAINKEQLEQYREKKKAKMAENPNMIITPNPPQREDPPMEIDQIEEFIVCFTAPDDFWRSFLPGNHQKTGVAVQCLEDLPSLPGGDYRSPSYDISHDGPNTISTAANSAQHSQVNDVHMTPQNPPIGADTGHVSNGVPESNMAASQSTGLTQAMEQATVGASTELMTRVGASTELKTRVGASTELKTRVGASTELTTPVQATGDDDSGFPPSDQHAHT